MTLEGVLRRGRRPAPLRRKSLRDNDPASGTPDALPAARPPWTAGRTHPASRFTEPMRCIAPALLGLAAALPSPAPPSFAPAAHAQLAIEARGGIARRRTP